jgi:hypothetical protein
MLLFKRCAMPSALLACALVGSQVIAAPSAAQLPDCPTSLPQRSGRISDAPGRNHLGKALTLLEQERFAAAYSSFKAALNEGLPDPLEKAQAFKNIALIMCNFKSEETCEQNLLQALYASADFSLEKHEIAYAGVERAYERAQKTFKRQCVVQSDVVDKDTKPKTLDKSLTPRQVRRDSEGGQLALTEVSSKMMQKNNSENATVLLNIKPWAAVAIDGGKNFITPPNKEIQVKPGEREISIENGTGAPIVIEADFKAGQVWVLQHSF